MSRPPRRAGRPRRRPPRCGVAVGAAVLFFGVVGLGVTVSRSISRPLRRLTGAAGVVAELVPGRAGPGRRLRHAGIRPRPSSPSVEVDSADEIGELAAAVNRVQATAAMLLERQVTTRSNVAIMFANIARRTQNLVGRQLQPHRRAGAQRARPGTAAAPLPAGPRGHAAAAQRGLTAGRVGHDRPDAVRDADPAVGRHPFGARRDRGISRGRAGSNRRRRRSPRIWSATSDCCSPNCWRTRRTSPRPARRSR